MNKFQIKIKFSILINKPVEEVWDYTQNYDFRTIWDSTVIETKVVQVLPHRIVNLQLKGNTSLNYVYTLDDRPHRTVLIAENISSPIIKKAGGSWTYENEMGQTRWTQRGTIIFKEGLLIKILFPFIKIAFSHFLKKSMFNAKRQIENQT